jgi:diguanylate cyclase
MVVHLTSREEMDPSGIRKALRLVASLRDSPAGDVIYRQLERMLDEIETHHLKVEIAYSGFVNSLLEAFATHLVPGSSRYVQVKLLQARLQPPLTVTELNTLSEFVNQFADQIRTTRDAATTAFQAAISPLLRAFGIEESVVAAATRAPADTVGAAGVAASGTELGLKTSDSRTDLAALTTEEADRSPEAEAELEREAGAEAEVETGAEAEAEAEAGTVAEPEAEAEAEPGAEAGDEAPEEDYAARNDDAMGMTLGTGDKDYHQELEARREDIRKVQSSLGQQVMETISQNEEFGVILDVVLAELRQGVEVAGIENARWTLIREVEKLMKGHNELADKLDSTHHYLQLVESDSRELTDELSRVRMLSLTDELTGLANRRAFMRRLEDEVARVQRYGFPLSFALMDLDHFKGVNDEFGHAAGDEVLRVYAKNILSVFRHHDMVARYGGEEFAVLLPNTDADGAIRALNKVRRRAGETRWQSNGAVSQVPTFSAGVSLFKPGESASAFIERADKALYRAKRLGRDRIELDITYESEESRRSPRRRSTDL